MPFDEALAVVHSAGIRNRREWGVWCKSGARPANMPADPAKHYKDKGWQGWKHGWQRKQR